MKTLDMDASVVPKAIRKHTFFYDDSIMAPITGVSSHSSHLGKLPRAQLYRTKKESLHKQRHFSTNYQVDKAPPSLNSIEEEFSQRTCSCLSSCPRLQAAMLKCSREFDISLNNTFRSLGKFIAKHTGYFIILPILIAILGATGVQQMHYEDDPEYLFAPSNGRAKYDRQAIDEQFPMNFSSFEPSRMTGKGRYARFIVSAKDGGTLMRQNVWDEIMKLNRHVYEMNITDDENILRFENLCAKWNEKCTQNKILQLYDILPQILNESVYLNYPVMLHPKTFEVYVLPLYLGGIEVNEEQGVASFVKAVNLFYWLRDGLNKEKRRASLWERKMIETFVDGDFEHINIARTTSLTLKDELEVNTASVVPFFGLTVFIMGIFTVASMFMSDWVRSKPILGLLGMLSAALGCVTAFGLLMYLQVPFIGINLAAPFLMLGIGIDDMFVMLAAWRRTQMQDSLEHRLGEAYAEAAVSITITSLTDMVSFFVGVITPFPSVQIFCIYTGTAVLMTYIYHITFFGGCMALAGRIEEANRHSVTFLKVKARSVAERENTSTYKFWCSGGINRDEPWDAKDNKPHAVMLFFRDCLAKYLNMASIKVLVIFMFVVYLGGAIYGCLNLEEGLERKRLSRYDSYSVDFYNMEDNYFREYPYRIQVLITGDLEYGKADVRNQILELHSTFENLSFITGSLYTESWMKGWYEFLDKNNNYLKVDTDNETDFIHHLRDFYLAGNDNMYSLDIKFNDDYTRIVASRFHLQTYRILNSNEDKNMMNGLREVADQSPLNITVYHPYFIFFDQFVLVRYVSMQAICLAAIIMMLVSLVFIPNAWCSLWVAFSIVSIEVGVIGYMTLWNVNLDSISMINLIMCIGFSVDFSAHISYAFLTAKVNTADERVKECLYTLGLPILQGAVSTIIGVSALVGAPSYIFVTFFKTVFLVIFFGAAHGLLLLPVLLSILGPGTKEIPMKSIPGDYHKRNSSSSQSTKPILLTKYSKPGTTTKEEDDERDFGIGTSAESSMNSSLSKATGIAVSKLKRSMFDYTNDAFTCSEGDDKQNNEATFFNAPVDPIPRGPRPNLLRTSSSSTRRNIS